MEPTMKVVKKEAVRQLQYVTALLEVLHGGGRLDDDQRDAAKQHLARAYRQIAEGQGKPQLLAAIAIEDHSAIGPLVTILTSSPNRQKNLLRLCLLDYLPRYREAVTAIAGQLSAKAKLTVNRPLFSASATERRGAAAESTEVATITLAGTPLMAFCEQLGELSEAITARHKELSRYGVPESSFFEPFAGFHFKLSRSLGFEGMEHGSDDLLQEQQGWQRLAGELEGLAGAALAFIQVMAPICPAEAVAEARRSILGLRALFALSHGGLSKSRAVFGQAARSADDVFSQRVLLSQQLSEGLELLAAFAAATKGFFRGAKAVDEAFPPASFLWQPFAQFLYSREVPPKEALAIAAKVKSYCAKNDAHPKDVAAEELRFLADALKPLYREFFQISTDGFLHAKNQDSRQKEAIMTRSEHLVHSLRRSGAATAGLILALLPALTGCGVKTAPRANIDNLRPAIPFKASAKAQKTPAAKARKTPAAKPR